jgi:hypothetical protein
MSFPFWEKRRKLTTWKKSRKKALWPISGTVRIRGGMPAIKNVWLPWHKSANRIKNMETLNQDFLEFIGLLETHGVDYLIIGGYAVALHGFPRFTGDIDELNK